MNCARFEEEQNLIAFQYRGAIFYKTYKVRLSWLTWLVFVESRIRSIKLTLMLCV